MILFLGYYHNGYYDCILYVWIQNMNLPKYIIHFEYSLDTMKGWEQECKQGN
jgi:hypothetical protein